MGMAGVWIDLLGPSTSPIVWRSPFRETAMQQELLVTGKHLGSILISDLELADTIAHEAVLARACQVQEKNLWILARDKGFAHLGYQGVRHLVQCLNMTSSRPQCLAPTWALLRSTTPFHSWHS